MFDTSTLWCWQYTSIRWHQCASHLESSVQRVSFVSFYLQNYSTKVSAFLSFHVTYVSCLNTQDEMGSVMCQAYALPRRLGYLGHLCVTRRIHQPAGFVEQTRDLDSAVWKMTSPKRPRRISGRAWDRLGQYQLAAGATVMRGSIKRSMFSRRVLYSGLFAQKRMYSSLGAGKR